MQNYEYSMFRNMLKSYTAMLDSKSISFKALDLWHGYEVNFNLKYILISALKRNLQNFTIISDKLLS